MLVHSRSARRRSESSKTGVTDGAEKRNGWCGALTATFVAMNKERQTTFLLVRFAFRRYNWLRGGSFGHGYFNCRGCDV